VTKILFFLLGYFRSEMFEYVRAARQMLQSGPFNSTSVTEAMVNQGTFLRAGGACLTSPPVLLP
jgi:hypothetical protein